MVFEKIHSVVISWPPIKAKGVESFGNVSALFWIPCNSILFMNVLFTPEFACAFLMERIFTLSSHLNLWLYFGVPRSEKWGEQIRLLFVSL